MMSLPARPKRRSETVERATSGGEEHAPGLIDDLVDSYEVETQGNPAKGG